MFEIGKRYTIKMWEDGEEGGVLVHYDQCEVVDYDAADQNPAAHE